MTEGTKYHPLFEYLLFSGQGQITLSFAEVEAILGASLPPSARKREEWWSNSPSGHSQARAWLRANYRTSNVDLAREKVDFGLEGWPEGYSRVNIRSLASQNLSGLGEATQTPYDGPESGTERERSLQPDHPLFGIWKGKVTLIPGHDYTRPAFEPDKTP